jgi:hypothetical protein
MPTPLEVLHHPMESGMDHFNLSGFSSNGLTSASAENPFDSRIKGTVLLLP